MTAQDTEATEFAAEWEHWHKQHEDRLAAPDGFLAITSRGKFRGARPSCSFSPATWSYAAIALPASAA